jgi:mannose-6-phosphate isomerase-like protein (cupin superfamily)
LVVVASDDVITLFDGSEYRVLERPSGPGDPVIMEFRLPDHCAEPLPHVHPHNVEVFEVLEGEVELLFGSEWQTVRAGESVTVARGERHTFRNHTASSPPSGTFTIPTTTSRPTCGSSRRSKTSSA